MQNDLFQAASSALDIINDQGQVRVWPNVLDPHHAEQLFNELLNHSPWQQEYIPMYGKTVAQPRLTCWYGKAGASASSRYTRITPAEAFSPALLALKKEVEVLSGFEFNSALLNLYRDGNDSMGYHADNEEILGAQPAIASLSLGASREFLLRKRHDKNIKHSIKLEHNSLLLMSGPLQAHWQHGISKTKAAIGARINLTFRYLYT